MSDKKHIDRLFQEKFKDFEAVPDEAMWSRIEKDLPGKKKKRRTVLLWWQLGGVAAVILLFLTIGISVFNSENSNNQEFPVVNTDANNSSTSPDGSNTTFDGTIKDTNAISDSGSKTSNQNDIIVDSSEIKQGINNAEGVANKKVNKGAVSLNNTNSTTSNAYSKEVASAKVVASNSTTEKNATKVSEKPTIEKDKVNSAIKETISGSNNALANKSSKTKAAAIDATNTSVEDNKLLNSEISVEEEIKKQSIQEAIAQQDDLINEKEKDEPSRWSISPNVAPVYFSSIGQGSPINEQFNENTKGSNVSMSYGIAGSYAISSRVKLRVGVNSVNLNQTTADVFAFSGTEIGGASRMARMDNVDYKGGSSNYAIMSSAMMNRAVSPELFNSELSGELEQRFGFIEVPLELEYRVLDKKFGVNVIGGFSTFFLNNNELYADVQGNSTLIGEATNINTTSFSANFGLGMDYSLSKQWNINLEPMFKYQINTFNNTSSEFRPFFIGVYSGLSFKF